MPPLVAEGRGVVVDEIHDGVDVDSAAVRELKYGFPDMGEHEISEHLALEEMRFIREELGKVEIDNLSGEERAGCVAFTEAWASAASGNSEEAVEGECSEDEMEGLTVANLQRQRAENNAKTARDEEKESKEEDKGESSEEETVAHIHRIRDANGGRGTEGWGGGGRGCGGQGSWREGHAG